MNGQLRTSTAIIPSNDNAGKIEYLLERSNLDMPMSDGSRTVSHV